MACILIAEDDRIVLAMLTTVMTTDGHTVVPVADGQAAIDALDAQSFDLILTDVRMEPVGGMDLLKHARTHYPRVPVIMVSGHVDLQAAVEAMRLGAFDYIAKPLEVDDLLATVRRALEYYQVVAENLSLKDRLAQFSNGDIVAVSPLMRKVCETILLVGPSDLTVLIQGPSGTGKELVAKSIHRHSHRKDRPFVAINCAAMPEPLLESELFGHAKGAFTGATAEKAGLFHAADQGTLFLDEIGSLPAILQGKLLRVLEERAIRRVGDTVTQPVDVRVLAATNQRLDEMMAAGTFREDLFYRLDVVNIDIPPLRKRSEDIPPLIDHFLSKEWKGPGPLPHVDPAAQLALERYGWPGNVRELENAIRHACTFTRDGRITTDALPPRVVHGVYYNASGDALIGKGLEPGKSLKAYVHDFEQALVRQTLHAHAGDKRSAARYLKTSVATLYRKLPELDTL